MASYYVALAASGGSAGNTGTSAGSPWTLAKLQTITLAAGDTVYWYKGDVFPMTWTFTTSGTAGNPITFDLFGSATNNAEFNGSGGSTAALTLNGCSYITINNIVIRNCSTTAEAPLIINNCHDITLYNCYHGVGKRGINVTNCTGNIVINTCWFSLFEDAVHAVSGGFGPAAGGGSGVQFNQCSGSGNKVLSSLFYTDIATAHNGVGDVISLYKCFFGTGDVFAGVGNFGMEVAYNSVRGGGQSPPSSGYCACVGGDVGGSNQYIHDNTTCTPGAVGMQVQGGTNINMSNNNIFGKVTTYGSVGLSFGNYSGAACNTITMGGNVINFYSVANSGVYEKFHDTSGNSTATGIAGGAALAQPTNWTTNTGDHVAGAVTDAILADPLFNPGDWNTPTSLIAITGRKINLI